DLAAAIGRWRQELHASGNDVDVPATLAVLLPGAATQIPVDCDALALREVLAAQLGLSIPGNDADEVGAAFLRPPVDGDQEVRDSLVVTDVFHLDVGGQISDQCDDVQLGLLLVVGEDNVAARSRPNCVETG